MLLSFLSSVATATSCDPSTVCAGHVWQQRQSHDDRRLLATSPSEAFCATEGGADVTYRLNDDESHGTNYKLLADKLNEIMVPMPPVIYIRDGPANTGDEVNYLVIEDIAKGENVEWIVSRGLKIMFKAVNTSPDQLIYTIPENTAWKPSSHAHGMPALHGFKQGACKQKAGATGSGSYQHKKTEYPRNEEGPPVSHNAASKSVHPVTIPVKFSVDFYGEDTFVPTLRIFLAAQFKVPVSLVTTRVVQGAGQKMRLGVTINIPQIADAATNDTIHEEAVARVKSFGKALSTASVRNPDAFEQAVQGAAHSVVDVEILGLKLADYVGEDVQNVAQEMYRTARQLNTYKIDLVLSAFLFCFVLFHRKRGAYEGSKSAKVGDCLAAGVPKAAAGCRKALCRMESGDFPVKMGDANRKLGALMEY